LKTYTNNLKSTNIEVVNKRLVGYYLFMLD